LIVISLIANSFALVYSLNAHRSPLNVNR
jgi:hypothetical protein